MRATLMVLAYNQERYVSAALQGALAQECEPLDILISDDASTDDTFAIASRIVSDYRGPHRVRLNRNDRNLGIANHVNRCMEMIDTEIVIAAAADDISMPQRAARVLETFRTTGACLVHSMVEEIGPSGERLTGPFPHDRALFLRSTSVISAARSMALYIGATGAWHRELFDRYGRIRFDKCYEDLVIGFRAALEGRIVQIREPLVQYRVGNGVTSLELQSLQGDAWRTRRLGTLRRNCAIIEQRRADTLCSQHPDKKILLRILDRDERNYTLRIASHEMRAAQFLLSNMGKLPMALRVLFSERRKMQRGASAIQSRPLAPLE